jgi:hypothetical protein
VIEDISLLPVGDNFAGRRAVLKARQTTGPDSEPVVTDEQVRLPKTETHGKARKLE